MLEIRELNMQAKLVLIELRGNKIQNGKFILFAHYNEYLLQAKLYRYANCSGIESKGRNGKRGSFLLVHNKCVLQYD